MTDRFSSRRTTRRWRPSQLARVLVSLAAVFASPAGRAQDHPRPAEETRAFRVFLLGNTGTPTVGDLAPTLEMLKGQLATAGAESAVIFLGDQMAGGGMPEAGAAGRSEAESQLMPLIETVQGYAGEVYFIPGDRDGEAADRAKALQRQEEFLESKFGGKNVFRPDGGSPMPVDLKLKDDIRLVVLDTGWLLQEGVDPVGGFETMDVYLELQEIMRKRRTDDILVVGHHPIYSNGRYGGHASPYYLLPVIGTAIFAAKRQGGDEQHFSNLQNEWMRNTLQPIVTEHEDVVYAAAHDYNLLHVEDEKPNRMRNFVVSGSAARSEHVAQIHDQAVYNTKLATKEKGFFTLTWYRDGSIWIDAWGVEEGGRRFYHKMIRRPELPTERPVEETGVAQDAGTVSIVPDERFKAGLFTRLLIGFNHRKVWTTEIEAPVIDLGEYGGLVPVKRGGGNQTISVRLEAPDEKQYVLRSVEKDARPTLPEEWQNTFLAAVGQDFLSYTHPYSAVSVPKLAAAVGVSYPSPRLVFVPQDPRLGEYSELVGNTLMLLEERPNKDMSDSPSFGGSPDVIGWAEMYRNVTRDNDDRVDAEALARVRLFDMWLSDWDRHRDQWRWGTFDDPDGKGKVYRPIARDRDQVFNRLNPVYYHLVMPFIVMDDYRKRYEVKGLTTSGAKQDHRFLAAIDRDTWAEIATEVQSALSDEVIDSAFREMPPEAYELDGEWLNRVGKIRRDKLPKLADRFYRLHAKRVDVVGTDKHERFEVTRLEDGRTEVVMYKTSKEGETRQELFRRVLRRNETREINLYGLRGNDRFVVKGEGKGAIRVNAVGGPGPDTFVDESRTRKVHFYDTPAQSNTWYPGPKTHVHQSDDPERTEYYSEYAHPRTFPFIIPWYNSDDGLILNLGTITTNHAFQKRPYASKHKVSLGIATNNEASSASYSGDFPRVFGYWGMGFEASYSGAANVTNFFGLGNDTVIEDVEPEPLLDEGLEEFSFELPFKRSFWSGIHWQVAPMLRGAQLDEERVDDLLQLEQPGLSEPTSDTQLWAGLRIGLDLVYKNDPQNPRAGYTWTTNVEGNLGVQNAPDDYAKVESDLALYASLPGKHQVTLALRGGGAHIEGTFPFWDAATLGGTTNLRGFESDRFSGRSSAYFNADLRLQLFRLRNAFLPGRLGVLGFWDTGRVWTDGGTSSDSWNDAYGFGLWYDIVEEVVLVFSQGTSDEGDFFVARLGFQF